MVRSYIVRATLQHASLRIFQCGSFSRDPGLSWGTGTRWMLSRQFAWDVVPGHHQIDHWSIVVADVKQHARKRTIWVVRVHTLRGTVASLV